MRTWPGPAGWIGLYAILDIAAIWPYNASNAAVPLAAVLLGHLPQTASDQWLVKVLGFTVFLLAFVPLIFGGTVYRMLEKIMTAKLVLVLGYLSIIAVAMVSWPVVRDVATGFFRFGTVPLRAQTIVLDRHFSLQSAEGETARRVRGTWEQDGLPTGDLFVREGTKRQRYDLRDTAAIPPELKAIRDELLARAGSAVAAERLLRPRPDRPDATLEAAGEIVDHHLWRPLRLKVQVGSVTFRYRRALRTCPSPTRRGSATCSTTRESSTSAWPAT